MFGTTASDAIGQSIARFFPERRAGDVAGDDLCRRRTSNGASDAERPSSASRTSLTARRANGETFPIEASVSCLDTSRRAHVHAHRARRLRARARTKKRSSEQAESLAKSASELKALNEELHRRQFELERAMTARSRFYASMSHELRTPINAVLGYSTLLLEHIYGPLNDKQAEGIERTQKAARHLLELVNDVLDLSKIEAGKIDLRLQPVEFPALIEDLFVTVRPLADEHGSALTLEQRRATSRSRSSPIRVGCVRFCSTCCRTRSSSAAASRSRVVVQRDRGRRRRDRGDRSGRRASRGDDQERIFHEFVQLGKTQLQDGTGLGLPISRRLAELLHGSLTVESTIGHGSQVHAGAARDGGCARLTPGR